MTSGRAPSRSRRGWFHPSRVPQRLTALSRPATKRMSRGSTIRQHPTVSVGPTTAQDCMIRLPLSQKGRLERKPICWICFRRNQISRSDPPPFRNPFLWLVYSPGRNLSVCLLQLAQRLRRSPHNSQTMLSALIVPNLRSSNRSTSEISSPVEVPRARTSPSQIGNSPHAP